MGHVLGLCAAVADSHVEVVDEGGSKLRQQLVVRRAESNAQVVDENRQQALVFRLQVPVLHNDMVVLECLVSALAFPHACSGCDSMGVALTVIWDLFTLWEYQSPELGVLHLNG